MSEKKAVELRHDGKTYRAGSREIFFTWAREHRISVDDSYRIAGTEKWIPVSANNELNILLDPENWWKIKMGGKTYVASDWDSIVQWAKDGRLSVDVQIEGPKTPPGGILGKASPELSPYLREWVPDDPKKKPLRLRFDGRTFIPGDVDNLKKWIQESRVPLEAYVSIQGEDWQLVTECGYFEKDMWPTKASLVTEKAPLKPAGTVPPRTDGVSEPPETDSPESRTEASAEDTTETVDDGTGNEQKKQFTITTAYGEEYVFTDPQQIFSLLKRKRVNSFDEIKHPDLPDGAMFISEYLDEYMPSRKLTIVLLILTILFGAAGAAAIIFQQQNAQWMLIGGIASLAIALVLLIRLIWKK
jgi:hypothetical protein